MIWTDRARSRTERRRSERRVFNPLFFWTPDMAYRAIVLEGRPVRDPLSPDRRSGYDRKNVDIEAEPVY